MVPGTVALTLGRSLNGKRTLLRGRKDPDDGWWSLTGCPVGTSQRTVMSCGCDPKGGRVGKRTRCQAGVQGCFCRFLGQNGGRDPGWHEKGPGFLDWAEALLGTSTQQY